MQPVHEMPHPLAQLYCAKLKIGWRRRFSKSPHPDPKTCKRLKSSVPQPATSIRDRVIQETKQHVLVISHEARDICGPVSGQLT